VHRGYWKIKILSILENKDPKHSCRVFFKEYAKCDSFDNNMAEIFNASIVEHIFKSITIILEDIFHSVMIGVALNKNVAYRLDQPTFPMILRKLEKGKNQSRWWQACPGGNGKYDVKHGSVGFVVDILDKTCTCGAWLLSGIPCCYALAVMREEN